MKERCIILNGNGTKNIVPVERIALVSLKETGNTFEATFYIDNALTVTIDGLTTEDFGHIARKFRRRNDDAQKKTPLLQMRKPGYTYDKPNM